MRVKFFLWKVAFQPRPLFSVRIEHQNGRSPESVEAAKVSGILLNVNMERNEILFDVRRQTGVFIRLFLKPNTSPSTGRGAKIYQQRPFLIFCFFQRLVGVCDPVNRHIYLLRILIRTDYNNNGNSVVYGSAPSAGGVRYGRATNRRTFRYKR